MSQNAHCTSVHHSQFNSCSITRVTVHSKFKPDQWSRFWFFSVQRQNSTVSYANVLQVTLCNHVTSAHVVPRQNECSTIHVPYALPLPLKLYTPVKRVLKAIGGSQALVASRIQQLSHNHTLVTVKLVEVQLEICFKQWHNRVCWVWI